MLIYQWWFYQAYIFSISFRDISELTYSNEGRRMALFSPCKILSWNSIVLLSSQLWIEDIKALELKCLDKNKALLNSDHISKVTSMHKQCSSFKRLKEEVGSLHWADLPYLSSSFHYALKPSKDLGILKDCQAQVLHFWVVVHSHTDSSSQFPICYFWTFHLLAKWMNGCFY